MMVSCLLQCVALQLRLSNARFTDNTAGIRGGGMAVWSMSELTATNTTFVNNSAPAGAGITLQGQGSSSFKGLFLHNNTAQLRGGGLEVASTAEVQTNAMCDELCFCCHDTVIMLSRHRPSAACCTCMAFTIV